MSMLPLNVHIYFRCPFLKANLFHSVSLYLGNPQIFYIYLYWTNVMTTGVVSCVGISSDFATAFLNWQR